MSSKNTNRTEEFKKLQEEFASLSNQFKQLKTTKSDMGEDKMGAINDMMERMMENVSYQMQYMREDMDYLNKKMMTHANPEHHLPPVNGAGQMEHCLKVLGMDKDYKIEKKTIYASVNKDSLGFNVEK